MQHSYCVLLTRQIDMQCKIKHIYSDKGHWLPHYDTLFRSTSLGSPLCSCCVPDPMGLSFLPPYGCQSNRTASVAALRMKAREHSEAVLQSANLLGAGPTTGPGVGLGQSTVSAGGSDSSPASGSSKITSLRRTPDKHLHCQKEGPDKKWGNLGCCFFS